MDRKPLRRGERIVREEHHEEYIPSAGDDVGRFRNRPDLVDKAEGMVPKMEEKYQNVKDNVKEKGSSLMQKGSDMMHSVADAGSNVMHKISDAGHDAWDKITGDSSEVEHFPRTHRVEEHQVKLSDYDPNNEFDELRP